jgi:hypothetical protein
LASALNGRLIGRDSLLIQINCKPGFSFINWTVRRQTMRQLDWATIAWSIWTALLAIAILYLLFYP